MRLSANNISVHEPKEIKQFSEWLLNVGDNKIAKPNDGYALIDIPEELLITDVDDPIKAISREVYGDMSKLEENIKVDKFFQDMAILCPKNLDVNIINEHMLDKLTSTKERIYVSVDSIDPSDSESLEDPVFTPDFLNSISLSGLPNHSIRLRVGAPVMLMRNIDRKGGLCNGKRLQILPMTQNVLQAKVIMGDKAGAIVLIPKVVITPSDTKLPFKMRRRQFPLSVAFAMSINNSQGQSLKNVDIFFAKSCFFSHGQLYVTLSRVTSKKGLKVFIVDKEENVQRQTMNIVSKEVFLELRLEVGKHFGQSQTMKTDYSLI